MAIIVNHQLKFASAFRKIISRKKLRIIPSKYQGEKIMLARIIISLVHHGKNMIERKVIMYNNIRNFEFIHLFLQLEQTAVDTC